MQIEKKPATCELPKEDLANVYTNGKSVEHQTGASSIEQIVSATLKAAGQRISTPPIIRTPSKGDETVRCVHSRK